jgi:hypothetical protein
MRTVDQAKEARRLYLELRAFGVSVKTRPYPGKPTGHQLGIFGLGSLPDDQRHALRERIGALQTEMISLVLMPGDPDAQAVLEEGAE